MKPFKYTSGSKEFYEIQSEFERFLKQYKSIYVSLDFEKDDPPAFYANGEIYKLFRAFMGGYALAKSMYTATCGDPTFEKGDSSDFYTNNETDKRFCAFKAGFSLAKSSYGGTD